MKTNQPTFVCIEHTKNNVTLCYTVTKLKLRFRKNFASVTLINVEQENLLNDSELKLARTQAHYLLTH